jgi:dihydrofolate reductase
LEKGIRKLKGETMRKIIVHEFITLDGVIQAPGSPTEDTDGGFTHGGWTLPYWHDEIGAHFGQIFAEADTLLLGRKTWKTHGDAFEPNPEGDPFGDMKKYVVSNTLKSADGWRDSTIIRGNVINEIRKLKNQPGKNIIMDGSSVLMHALIENDLVDEYALHVYPLVLGSGKRLFPEGKRVNLKLIESTALPTGVLYQRYQPA